MTITLVAGARPNFMKIAPIIHAIKESQSEGSLLVYRLVHTGQHYDKKMSGDFFEQLNIPEPDNNLNAGGGTQAEQTAAIMIGFEKELTAHRPDLVLVVGDVTSTMACTITAKKLCIPVAHVEAGIRSGDMTMPEEINRLVTDSICDYFFTTTKEADDHLIKSGIESDRIHWVGNTMIDTLLGNINKLKKPDFWDNYLLSEGHYLLLTLHRPANVDEPENLRGMLEAVLQDSSELPVVFPVHPRTRAKIKAIGFSHPRLLQIDPLGYHEFIFLVKNCKAVITDSGGITEEATVLGIPCMTLRDSTERPETVTVGTNELVGIDPQALKPYLDLVLAGRWKEGTIPEKWDGKTGKRIVQILLSDRVAVLRARNVDQP